jgi:hypothetical protein
MRWILAVAVIGAWLWWRGDDRHATRANDGGLQTAVLANGFAIYDGHDVVELDRKGKQRKQHRFEHSGDVRLVGTAVGPAAGRIRNRKFELVRVSTGKGSAWGQSARLLCEGAATNDERFAVGWIEGDDGLTFVHGDLKTKRSDETEDLTVEQIGAMTVGRRNWCGIASAQDKIALFWRDSDRLFIGTCTRKKCELPGAVAFDRNQTLLGFGCLRNACLLAARDRSSKTRLMYVTESGAVKWQKPLDTSLLEVSIIGAGENAFAVGYGVEGATNVVRVDRKGAITPIWQGSAAKHAPALAWSRDQLLVAHTGSEPHLVGFPR